MIKFGGLVVRLSLLFFVLVAFSACNKEDDMLEENIVEIEQYILDNNLEDVGEVVKTESGLHYIVKKEGDGDFPDANSRVKVGYTGFLTDNTIFDANPNAEFSLSGVIKGWTEGIPKFSRGGEGILLIPAVLGYGSSGTSGIPGGAVLIFEVDLIDF